MPIIYTKPDGSWLLRCELDNGAIWFWLRGDCRGDMNVSIFDEELLIAMNTQVGVIENDNSKYDISARNKYGTARILRACRLSMACFPAVKNWVYERISGASNGGERMTANG